ncbi:histidine phosphatase family protein [Chloroflexota bacterium]
MSKLLLVRHGDTELNSAERYWGCSDVKLSAAGSRQAERLRDRLAAQKVDAIYSSDLKRASVTAGIIASRHQLDIITCAELREINFGELEGLTFDKVSQLYPEVTKLWVEGSPELEYPGGESLNDFNERVSNFATRLGKHTPEETILIVAHCGVLMVLMCQLSGIGLGQRRQFYPDLASLSIMETYGGRATLTLLNDVSHLG